MSKYVFGFDFGTLSCRGVAINLENGNAVATAEKYYPHGVISGSLPNTTIRLGTDWYLQDPDDWIECLALISRKLLEIGNIKSEDVLAIGTDFTSCTLLPIKKDGTPLCKIDGYQKRPNAWPKLWKHHGAEKYAEEIEAYAKKHTDWLKTYFGNSVSSEWVYPKILQVVREDPDIYQAADYFMEAVDYIVLRLTGNNTRTNGVLGVNAFYIEGKGYPDEEFAEALDPLMKHVATTKLAGRIVKVGDNAGHITAEMGKLLGLSVKTVIASGHSDGAVAGCGAGVTKSGSMLIVMGTSTCHQMMYKDFHPVDGICSIAADGMIPGLYGYESGQPSTGDIFSWFAANCVPKRYWDAAEQLHIPILSYLGNLAEKINPGESGLISLDWFNGNRSILSNYNLSGLIVGLTLGTKTEEIYRSLVEGNIFGSYRILQNLDDNGVKISDIFIVGGIAQKSPWIMQMCADVFGKDIIVPLIDNVPARGAAVCAAVALGKENNRYGFTDFAQTCDVLTPKGRKTYNCNWEKHLIYQQLYKYYLKLHDEFGLSNDVMKNLRDLQVRVHHGK